MENVVLHYQAGSDVQLSSLLETTERLLEPFPCRTPPVFTPWFPSSAADHRLPIRPAKPAPVITSSGDLFISESRPNIHTASAAANELQEARRGERDAENHSDCPDSETTTDKTRKSKDAVCVSETPDGLLPESPCSKPKRAITRLSPDERPQKDKDPDCPIRRSWSIFTQRGVLLRSSQSLSEQFHHMVSIHRLHLRQRAKWVISVDNCGRGRDIEQVWRTLSRSVRSSGLPTCNANIQRERAEIWVFCDVLHSEQVGRFLKDELRLTGSIGLSVHRLGNVFSM